MKKIAYSLLVAAASLASCVSGANTALLTEGVASMKHAFDVHSSRWEKIFLAGNPSSDTRLAVMQAANMDRMLFAQLAESMLRNLESLGLVDAQLYQQMILEMARDLREITDGQ